MSGMYASRRVQLGTDLSPGDTGQILGEASVKTTGMLMDSPIRASLEWRRG